MSQINNQVGLTYSDIIKISKDAKLSIFGIIHFIHRFIPTKKESVMRSIITSSRASFHNHHHGDKYHGLTGKIKHHNKKQLNKSYCIYVQDNENSYKYEGIVLPEKFWYMISGFIGASGVLIADTIIELLTIGV